MPRAVLVAVRYGLPGALVVGAFVMLLVAEDTSTGLEGFAMGIGGAIAVLLFNLIWRLGFEGDREREREEAARRHLMRHGRWPDDDEEPSP